MAKLLTSSEAHLNFDDSIAGFAPAQRGIRPPGAAHTAWQLLEHLRICQWDILEFSRNPKHASPAWPDNYWPATDAPPNEEAWDHSIAAFHADLRAMTKLIADPHRDLYARINHPDAEAKHTLLREALLLADHNAYHIGQLVLLRRLLT
ncbi:MAG: DinB family protein [Candidatus Acidiferrales bacterium]